MNKYISCVCAILLSITSKAQTELPGQCQAGMPKILNSELIKEKEIKQYFPAHYSSEQMHNTILLLIRNWSKKRGYT